MYWILAAIFALLALTVPRLRPFAMVGCVVLALLFSWALVQRMRGDDVTGGTGLQRSGAPSSPGIASQTIAPDLVGAERMVLQGGGAPFELRGYLHNAAPNLRLRSVTIRITRLDCHERVLDPSGCEILWQDQHWMPVAIEPGEGREFSTAVWMRGSVPRPRGELKDGFEVVAASGEPVEAPAGQAAEHPLLMDEQEDASLEHSTAPART